MSDLWEWLKAENRHQTAFGPYLRIGPGIHRLTAEEIAERDESVQLAYALQRAATGGRQC